MIEDVSPVTLETGAGWAAESLEQGSGLAVSMTRLLSRFTSAVVLHPSTAGGAPLRSLDDRGRGIRSSDADVIAKHVLESFGAAGVRTIVVEDDVRRRGDPTVEDDVAFISDRVVRWADLGVGAGVAVSLLRGSAYPLNAFACWAPSADLGLAAGASLSESEVAALIESTCAVISAVYDAETYLVLMTHDLGVAVSRSGRELDRRYHSLRGDDDHRP